MVAGSTWLAKSLSHQGSQSKTIQLALPFPKSAPHGREFASDPLTPNDFAATNHGLSQDHHPNFKLSIYPLFAMASLSAKWTRLASSERLGRSSQSLSVLGSRAWVFGGELFPRQPVDNRLDVIELGSEQGTNLQTAGHML